MNQVYQRWSDGRNETLSLCAQKTHPLAFQVFSGLFCKSGSSVFMFVCADAELAQV